MEQSPSWEAKRSLATQEIPCMLWNLKVHHHIHKSPLPIPILCQIDSFPRPLRMIWKTFKFLQWGVFSTAPNPQTGEPPLVCCPWLLIQYICSCFSSRNLRMHHAMVTGTHLPHMHTHIWKRNTQTAFHKQLLRFKVSQITFTGCGRNYKHILCLKFNNRSAAMFPVQKYFWSLALAHTPVPTLVVVTSQLVPADVNSWGWSPISVNYREVNPLTHTAILGSSTYVAIY